MSTLTIQPYRLNLDGSVSATGSAASAIAPQATDVLSEAGHGSVTFKNSDPVLDVLGMDGRDILQVRIDGTPVFAFMPDPAHIVSIAQGETKDELTQLSGPGLLGGILSRRLVYPTGGPQRRPKEIDRFSNWTHPLFDYAAVADGNSKELITVGQAKTDWPDPWADDFPLDIAFIIWADNPGGNTSTYLDADAGHCWFWYDIPVLDGTHRLFWTTDNRGEAYWQGQQISTSDTFTSTAQQDVDATAGTVRLAFHVDNSARPITNDAGPGGLAWAVYRMTSAGGILVAYSFAGVQVLAYEDDPPGVTPGQAWIWIDDEAEVRGCEPIARTFDEDDDSNSNAWPEVADIATSVKNSMLAWQGELAGTYADFRFNPDLSGGLELSMYRIGEMGTSSGVTLVRGGNLTSLEHQRENMPITVILAEGAEDWYEAEDTGGTAAYGRVEAALDIGAPASSAEVNRILDGQLVVFAQPREEIDAGVQARTNAIPGIDFVVGDLVTVPDSTGVSDEERCVAITWTTKGNTPEAVFTCAFRDVVLGDQERIVRMAAA